MITALILTLDEERHIARCIESLKGQCMRIVAIDSGSKDRTVEIAERLGARVLRNPWVNHATQMNFAIDAVAGVGGWLLRIDADEVLDSCSGETLQSAIARAGPETDGILVKRRIHFLGRRIRHGAIEPSLQLRLWREGHGRCEQRWMDEHIEVRGRVVRADVVISDINLNSISWWTDKHNSYASREAIEILLNEQDAISPGLHWQARAKRLLKKKVYQRLPGGVRAGLYFLYRYIFRLGMFDGSEGLYFHLLQALWYRTLVDAKVHEIEARMRDGSEDAATAIAAVTGLPMQVIQNQAAARKARQSVG